MEANEIIVQNVKTTIGYYEAKDKTLFMVGANVGINKTKEYYEEEINRLKQLSESYRKSYEKTYNDLNTISNILSNHSS